MPARREDRSTEDSPRRLPQALLPGSGLENANLRLLIPSVRYSDVERACVIYEEGRSGPLAGIGLAHQLVVVRIYLREDADGPFASRNVDALVLGVVENVVRVARRIESG